MLAGSIPHGCSLLYTFVFVCWRYVPMVVRHLGNVFCTMSGNALRLMPKIGLVESCERKFVATLHIELVIMYKLFLHSCM
jgi:hypothetical protein